MCAQTNDTLNILFQEVGAHLRASDDIREGIANIFFTIVLAAISGLVILRVNNAILTITTIRTIVLLGTGLIAFGETVLWGVIAIRKWHAEYVNCLILLQAMITNNLCEPDENLIPPNSRYPYSPHITTSRTYLLVEIGIGCLIAGVGDVVASIIGIPWMVYTVVLILIFAMFFLNNRIARRVLKREEKKFWSNPKCSWCLAGCIIVPKLQGKG